MEKLSRPSILTGVTYKIKCPNNSGELSNVYLIINNDEQGRAFEIFIRCDDPTLFEHITAVTLLVTDMLRRGISLLDIADTLGDVHSPNTAHMIPGTHIMCPSLYARIAHTFRLHVKNSVDVPKDDLEVVDEVL